MAHILESISTDTCAAAIPSTTWLVCICHHASGKQPPGMKSLDYRRCTACDHLVSFLTHIPKQTNIYSCKDRQDGLNDEQFICLPQHHLEQQTLPHQGVMTCSQELPDEPPQQNLWQRHISSSRGAAAAEGKLLTYI